MRDEPTMCDRAAVSDRVAMVGGAAVSAADVMGIHALLAEYALAADECRFEDWARLFTRDGEMQSPSRTVRGYEALVDFIANATEGLHLCTLPRIEVVGDHATAATPFLFVPHDGSLSRGLYEDDLCRTREGWRIGRRRGRLLHAGRA
jgi:hypothetical protein